MSADSANIDSVETYWIRHSDDLAAVAKDAEHGWFNVFLERLLNWFSRDMMLVSQLETQALCSISLSLIFHRLDLYYVIFFSVISQFTQTSPFSSSNLKIIIWNNIQSWHYKASLQHSRTTHEDRHHPLSQSRISSPLRCLPEGYPHPHCSLSAPSTDHNPVRDPTDRAFSNHA